MGLNPYTLQHETEEEKQTRQSTTGELGQGLVVLCRPTDDPAVVQQQNRAACLTRPYQNCSICPHSSFTMVFRRKDLNQLEQQRRETVLCPRWAVPRGFLGENSPDSYVSVERGTCEVQPFDFCRECPAVEELFQLGIDKGREEWYSRWRRFSKEDEDGG